VVLGCVTPIGDQGSDIAKTAAQVADWDVSVAGVQINRFCASGLEAVNLGAMKVRSGFEDLVVVGGVESMSRVPMGSDGGAWALDPETNLHSHFTPQGVGADLIATLEGFSRQDVDAYALHSQQKAARARADGSFRKSLVPVQDQNGIILLDHDEFIRAESTLEGLGKLKPSFEMIGQMGFDATALRVYSHVERINHVHTPGNSSGIVDGAALMLIGSEAKGRALGLQPRARIVATAVTSTDPTIMLTGPRRPRARPWPRPGCGSKTSTCSRSTRLCFGGVEIHQGHGGRPGEGQRQRRLHCHGPPAGRYRAARFSAPCSMSWKPGACAMASRPCVSAAAWALPPSSNASEPRFQGTCYEPSHSLRKRPGPIVVLTIDMPGQSANTMNAVYREAMAACVARLVTTRTALPASSSPRRKKPSLLAVISMS
jgi:hypothetical protein